ncbi:lamin tail domain-containing protein [Candidatus Palauibacter soopunensis]|uniref:MBL fold metallo-hydrolase n=1 Tax=Candidatus Palauibacter soopunensis TaxID=3056739 RepID=UPI002394C64A|nr:lamin tail domain-containing protein [Candidatus Palauibacter soopunensis]MDE2878297.1 lamin tail domain-containing protein [Candidatus Palauibacter soopunensis]
MRRGWERLRRVLAVATVATLLAAPVFATAPSAPTADPDSVLRITFLDVGQADAVLIQAPGGRTALIDAGRDDVAPLLRQFGVSEIDLLVATHPHADHIGGMAGVIAALPVRFYMDNGEPHTTQTYRRLLAALDARPEITYLEASPRTLTLGEVEIDVLPLLPRGTTNHNDRSVSLLVRFGEFRAFLSGDSEVRQLTHLMNQGAVRELALLKAPHHGSDNGFTREFLNAARPRVVVISVGRNSYGHPRPAALRAYEASGATVFRTDWHGHVSVQGRESGDYEVSFGGEIALRGRAGDRPTHRPPVAAPGPASVPAGAGDARLRLWVHADAPGNDHRNPNGEYAVIRNLESGDRPIGGWSLCDRANHCFRFPAGAVLEAGGQLVVHTGAGRADATRYYMGRRQAVWNNNGDTATLYDDTGAVVVVFDY